MLSQVEYEVQHYQLLNELNGHKRDDSVITTVNGFIKSINGNLHQKRTTRGWKLLVEWRDGSVNRVLLKDLKQSILVELYEYTVANEISDETAFKLWVEETLRH